MLNLYQPCQQRKHWKIEFITITYPINEHDNSGDKSEQLYTFTDHHTCPTNSHRQAYQEHQITHIAKRTFLEQTGNLQTGQI